ncbi:MAG: hypothetical protein IPL61_07100 [Myxococcales bacterium]|nr:hypothetical protein [Myxococcales bacterium]
MATRSRAALATSASAIAAVLAGAAPATADVPTPPTVVTRALMRELAAGTRPFASLVDRAAGVVFIDHFDGAGDPQPVIERRLCGRALDRQLRKVKGWMFAALHGDPEVGAPRCHNRPGPPGCTFGGSMAWDPAVHLHFRLDPDRGVVLRAITVDDEVLVDPAAVAAEHRAQARLIARLGARPCPSP